MFKRIIVIFSEFLIATLIILFFSSFGQHPSFIQSSQGAYSLVMSTIHGEHLRANYAGVSWSAIWVSFRLLIFAIIASAILGLLYAVLSFRLPSKRLRGANELLSNVLETIPEAMYVVIVFVVLVDLLTHGINIPGFFYDGLPRWQDTFVPAFALALPGIFYLRRILTLRMRDEVKAQYVETAFAKGLSETQVFYRHVLPNVLPVLYRQLPVIVGFVISSALFAEFFLGYMGFLFRFTLYAGWGMITGAFGIKKPTGIPAYQPGAIFTVGLFLVGIWFLASLVSEIIQTRHLNDIDVIPTPSSQRVGRRWITIGSAMILLVCFFSAFPKILTNQSPTKEHLLNPTNMTFPPYPPSGKYLFGTDPKGRDLLSQTLHGTFPTLLDVALITIIVVIVSLSVSTLIKVSESPLIVSLSTRIGRIMAALPTLFIVFLALYSRNLHSPFQLFQYVFWVSLFEVGRGVVALNGAMDEWFQFGFVEGAESIGQSRFSILYHSLRSWLSQFILEFTFTEFTRVMSFMTLLAMFHMYPIERIVSRSNVSSIGAAQITWFSILGDAANQVSYLLTYPFLVYAPFLFLFVTMLGASFIAHGLRTKT